VGVAVVQNFFRSKHPLNALTFITAVSRYLEQKQIMLGVEKNVRYLEHKSRWTGKLTISEQITLITVDRRR